MKQDWPYHLREHRGTLLAFAAFVVMFTIYAGNHPVGLNANVGLAQKALRLAFGMIPSERTGCPCPTALKDAITTAPELIPAQVNADLKLIAGKYLP